MDRLIDRAAYVLYVAGAALSAVLIVIICYDCFARILFNAPFAGTAEIAAAALVLIAFAELPYAILHKKLLRVVFFYDRVGPLGRSMLNVLAYGVGTAFFFAIVYMSIEPTLHSIAIREFEGTDAFRLSVWPIRIAAMLLWAVSGIVCTRFLWLALCGKMNEREEQIPE